MICPKLLLFGQHIRWPAPAQTDSSPKKCKMHIPETNLPCIDVLLLNLTTRVSGETPAKRSLEVAELDQRDRRIHIANEVAYIGQRSQQQFLLKDQALA